MSRKVRLSLLVLLAVSCAACTNEDSSVIVLFNQRPAAGCMTIPNTSQPGLVSGVIDTNAAVGYILTPLVQNTASTMGGSATESQRLARIEGADIRVSFPNGGVSEDILTTLRDNNLLAFSERFSFTIFPNNGLAVLQFVVLPQPLLQAVRGQVGQGVEALVSAQLFGTIGGGSIESQEFVYPITICDGCLQNYLGPCDTSITPSNQGGACQPLQDGIADCCGPSAADPSTYTCPAVTSSP